MSHHPKEIKHMIKLLNLNDLIIGSRYINGVSVVNWPIRRLVYKLWCESLFTFSYWNAIKRCYWRL